MENKLNFSAIESYAKAYTAKICDDLFKDKAEISGNELLRLPIEQIGLFVLNSIYSKWQTETGKVKSPFFNYDAPDVQLAVKKLMNVLSKNISVDRENLEPLLLESTKDTILLSVSPFSYFKNLISTMNDDSLFLEFSRFVKINSGFADEINKSIESNGFANLNDRFDHIFNELDISPDNSSSVIEKLSATHPIAESDFFLTMEVEVQEEEEEVPTSTESTLNDNFVGTNYETVADQLKEHHSTKGSIKSMLSINQKFMFINDLFNDNQDDFNKVVDFIEGCESKEAALSFISNNYLKHNIWNPNAPQVREFLRLIDLQFE